MATICTVGQLIAERFLIVRYIAEGGMGEVYEAEDQVLGERVALKFLSRRSVGDDLVLRRFRREIQLARKVTHPNVCRLFDVYEHRVTHGLMAGHDVAFVTMELLAGDTLETVIQRDGPMTEADALPLVEQMATALEAAHRVGIIHRDFKSSNVMLVPTDGDQVRAVVTDFGLAQSLNRQDPGGTPLTDELKLVGTPDYMSPEQLRGAELAEQSDVYSLGVVMFEMVTGHHPYEAENTMALLVKRVSEPPRTPRQLNASVSERWEETILRCLDGDPAGRPESPPAVVASLRGRVVTPVADNVDTAPTVEPDSPPVVRSRGWWALATLIGLALAFALVLMARRTETPKLGSFSPVQLTTGPGLELDPAFSPDGEAMVYSAEAEGRFALFVRELAPGGAAKRLTFGAGQAFEPTWSPDGQTIVFHDAGRGGLWSIPARGGQAEQVSEFGARPAFAPDGGAIAFQTESVPALADTSAVALAGRLWFLELAPDAEPRALTTAGAPPGGHGAPAFSPRGDRVVFTASQRGRSEIWSVALDGGPPAPLVREPVTASDPVWSPEGDYVYFSASVRQVHGLWRVPVSVRTGAAAGDPEQIANVGLASIRQLAMTPDLKRVAYSAMLTRSNLWTLPLDPETHTRAGRARRLTEGNGRSNRPAWSPDGERIAFDRWQLGVNLNIWVMDRARESIRQITTATEGCSQASWLGADDRMGFMSMVDGQRQLVAVDLASATTDQLVDLPASADWALVSPDGRRVVYHTRGDVDAFEVWVRDLPDGNPRRITSCDGSCGFPVWSPDGAWLALQARVGGHSQVVVVPSNGGEMRQLTFGAGQSWPFSFSPDGERIAFAGQRDHGWSLWWVSRTSGHIERLTDAGRLNTYARYPAWSPRGDEIVYERAETVGDIWLVDHFLSSPK